MLRALLALAAGLLFGGCASPPPLDARTDLVTGLRTLGRVETFVEADGPLVVVIKDRHAVHGAITRVRGRLRSVQTENSRAVRFLVSKGFRLLGCEAPRGDLPEEGPARAHREAVREALADGDDVNALTVYQPLRYAVEFAERLVVKGVEDPELYAADVAALEEIIELRGILTRNDTEREHVAELVKKERQLVRLVRSHADARGRYAAENLLKAAAGQERAMLMLGGAHAPGIVSALREQGARVILFECRAYSTP